MVKKKLKLMKPSGKIVDLPEATIKKVLKSTGFTGNLLTQVVGGVLGEAANLAREGVVTVTNLEKAVVKAIRNTNQLAMNTAQKFTKKWLK